MKTNHYMFATKQLKVLRTQLKCEKRQKKSVLSMVIKYFEAPDVKSLIQEIVEILSLSHIELRSIYCFRSIGSKSRHTIARIYGLEKIWQKALHTSPAYVIEVISERYDRLAEEEKEKTLIHELLHVPKGFLGGFRPHKGYVDGRTVERLFAEMHEKMESTWR